MTVPLMILAVLSLIGGFFGLPAGLGLPNGLERWLEPIFEPMMALAGGEAHHMAVGTEVFLLVLSSVIALGGIGLAYFIYLQNPSIAENTARSLAPLYNVFVHKYYVDEIYNAVFVRPGKIFGQFLSSVIDNGLIDTLMVDGSAKFVGVLGKISSGWQTGYLRNYVTSILIGSVLLSLYFFLR
jgi:NADH-quinone oxidoreductase subunit L